ncbi:MAG: hypothetical protein HY706_22485 [Candidatus Hydrogenedentes bacterium]|nr:hypothetical protein [Candidatus Hydrogenedentota bacterium]
MATHSHDEEDDAERIDHELRIQNLKGELEIITGKPVEGIHSEGCPPDSDDDESDLYEEV